MKTIHNSEEFELCFGGWWRKRNVWLIHTCACYVYQFNDSFFEWNKWWQIASTRNQRNAQRFKKKKKICVSQAFYRFNSLHLPFGNCQLRFTNIIQMIYVFMDLVTTKTRSTYIINFHLNCNFVPSSSRFIVCVFVWFFDGTTHRLN